MSSGLCLIVDDEPAIRGFLRTVLRCRPLEVLEADDAISALRLIRKLDGHLDLIVTDIRMPGDMNGVDLAHSVRNMYPAIPVVLISGYCDEHANGIGGFSCIPKPFLPETILKAVEKALHPETRKQSFEARHSA